MAVSRDLRHYVIFSLSEPKKKRKTKSLKDRYDLCERVWWRLSPIY